MPETTTRKPRTVERRVAALRALYSAIELTPDGTFAERVRSAKRGELLTLTVGEAARLDALGALGPVGCTAEDIERDIEAGYKIYQASRRGVPGDL